jgi:hypothetical protein
MPAGGVGIVGYTGARRLPVPVRVPVEARRCIDCARGLWVLPDTLANDALATLFFRMSF